jgi:hypothetical protein
MCPVWIEAVIPDSLTQPGDVRRQAGQRHVQLEILRFRHSEAVISFEVEPAPAMLLLTSPVDRLR